MHRHIWPFLCTVGVVAALICGACRQRDSTDKTPAGGPPAAGGQPSASPELAADQSTAPVQPSAAPESQPIRVEEYSPTITPGQAAQYTGRQVFVIGHVARANRARTSGHVFLDLEGADGAMLTIFIRKDRVAKFAQPPEETYRDKNLKVHGFVSDYKGKPEIALAGPDKITILPEGPLPALPPTSRPASRPASAPTAGSTITIAEFNVLNLFDPFDDPYTNDETTDPKPRAELEAVAGTIHRINADVLALEEVENRGYLQRFADVFLPDMGYEVVEYEGNDVRGIDVAVLSRVPVGPVTSYRHLRFPDSAGHMTHYQRDLLRVRLQPAGARAIEMFVVHLKSKDGVADGGIEIRMGEARTTRQILDDVLRQDPDAQFVICGDFNDTIDSEPLRTIIGNGAVTLTSFTGELPPDQQASYNQPPFLSMIDFILASPAMARHYVPHSYHILTGGSPATTGSDHNPVLAKFTLTP